MLPAATKKGGLAMAGPDVCLTPPGVPVGYPNMGMLNGTVKVAAEVLMENKETVCEDSQIPTSKGDEGGVMLGVKSGTVMGPVTFKTYSSKVYAQGKKVVFHTAVTGQNGSNANIIGCHVTPSQSKVLVAL